MRVLVTGADGFVGRHLVRQLVAEDHAVVPAVGPESTGERVPLESADRLEPAFALDLTDAASVREAARTGCDAVVHLAAVSSGREGWERPAAAWAVNAQGTWMLAQALAEARGPDAQAVTFLLASSAEVYGRGTDSPRVEDDAIAPCSPYAATKAAAEIGALEVFRRTGLRVVVARPFPHTGPGQDTRFVAPAFVERIREAKRLAAPAVMVGRLDPVREWLDVRDVATAYTQLLTRGQPGDVYNISGGAVLSIADLFVCLCDILGYRPIPETDHSLVRPADIPNLTGSAEKLRAATGWTPVHGLEETLADLVHAQTH